jgi:hypothetical protein
MEAGSGEGKNSQDDDPSAFGDVVTMRARHFLNEPMGPEHAELSADRRGTPSPICRRPGFGGVERFLKVAIAQTVDQKISSIDGGQKLLILSPRM